jgi:UDP-N-acetylmuramyl pentapeptide phosphotransferase/UDP-N-acetylglucosamine-1-phosphate transferase
MWTTLVISIILLLGLLFYFLIADKYNIIDKPNERSSHTAVTLRGGGIIFPVGALLFLVFYGYRDIAFYLPLTLSILIIGIVSFCDDVKSLSNKARILFHLVAVSLMLYAVQAFTALPLWLIPIVYIIIIGTINAYNFMDGINGITGLYSLSVLLGCFYFNHHIKQVVAFEYITIPIIACIVFLFFNFRKKAKCFAGDVGSVSIGLWIISLLLLMILATNDLRYILFLAVYGVDSIFTIIHRLMLGQNIF